jgi:hypothetical protein
VQAGDGVATLRGGSQRSACGGKQGPPGRGQRYAPVAAYEQGLTEFAFQRGDRGAQARLREVNLRGGPGEVQLVSERNEVRQLT